MIRKNKKEQVLSETDKNKFRRLLLSKRAEIIGDVGSMQNSVLNRNNDMSHSPSHMAEVGSDNYETENILGLVESEIKLLVEIEEALKRLEKETFGVCEENGEFIPKARLKAIPWTRYCVKCASQIQKFSRGTASTRKKYYYAPGNDDKEVNDNSFRNVLNYEKD